MAHSHGGVWAHEAIRAVPGPSVQALVDLDCSSYGWSLVGHDIDNAFIGGDPRDAFDIGLVVNVPTYASVPNEQNGTYDTEDVVFSNVVSNLEVRSGGSPLGGEWFDEKWNMRSSGSTTGIYYFFSDSSHDEVHQPGGSTLAVVRPWIRARLGP